MSDSYTLAALRGLGMDGDDSYTSAALRGFGDESYTSAALRGFGDESYTDAALRGCGCDCGGSYTDAALRGMGKLKKGSPEAKAYMARLRAMRASKSKAGKKLKGGIAFSTIAAALGLIPTAIRGAHAIYDWVKGAKKKSKGGRALILDPEKRTDYIRDVIMKEYTGRRRSAFWPYKLDKAAAHAAIRRRALGPKIVKYLEDNDLLNKAIFNTAAMKKYRKEARSALLEKNIAEMLTDESDKPKKSKTSKRPKVNWFEEDIIRKRSKNPKRPRVNWVEKDLPKKKKNNSERDDEISRDALGFPTGDMIERK